MEGNAIKKPINLTTAPYKTLFLITREMTSELMSRVIKDPNRKPVKIWNLIQMAELYVVQSSDKARITRCGGISLKSATPADLQQNKTTWEKLGITKGCLPNIVYLDEDTGEEYEAFITMNGLEIDIENEEYIRKINTLISFQHTMVHEAMQEATNIFNKFFASEERDMKQKPTTLFPIIEKIQHVYIVLQNAMFLNRQAIKREVNTQSLKIPTNRQEAINMKDVLQLNLAMLEKAECKPTRSSDQGIVDDIIRNHKTGMTKTKYANEFAKYAMSHLIYEKTHERGQGLDVELDTFLDEIVQAFEEEENDVADDTLQAALMTDTSSLVNRQPDPRPRNGSGGVQRNNRPPQAAEQAFRPHQDSEVITLGIILKTLHDMKSDMGTMKKMMGFDSSKPVPAGSAAQKFKSGWRPEEQREKMKSRFAGAMERPKVKIPKKSTTSSRPQPLTSRVVSVEESDSDSEQSANFAGVMEAEIASQLDYRILTAGNNVIVLGEKCLRSFMKSPQHVSDEAETEQSDFRFMRNERTMCAANSFRFQEISSLLSASQASKPETTVTMMADIGGQEEVVIIDDVRMPSPLPLAAYPWTGSQPATPECTVRSPLVSPSRMVSLSRLPSPSAPQVENYALDVVPIQDKPEQAPIITELLEPETQAEQVEDTHLEPSLSTVHVVRPRTRSVARVERLVIPTSLDLSDSEEEDVQIRIPPFTKKPFGSSKSAAAAVKKATDAMNRRIALALKNITNKPAERIVRSTRSSSAVTTTTRSKKQRTSSVSLPTPRLGNDDEDSDASSGRGPPDLISASSDDDA